MSRPSGEALLEALEAGEVRAAERDAHGRWTVHAWVKEGILRLFRESAITGQAFEASAPDPDHPAFRDKAPLAVRRFSEASGVRLVPGGSAVRRGVQLGQGVVCMPPMYANIGAFVGAGTMIDSHVLVGSCAQIGTNVHLSAAAQIGGVLEPAGARPVIVEDGAFVGGNTGLFEGVLIRERAVIGAGVVLAAATPVFDLVNERELRGTREEPLEIPAGAVLVPG
jgi:2,3,4,5-tetrahydropyridine-2-carboxylate N-succinyltransferase